MPNVSAPSDQRRKTSPAGIEASPEHYLRLLGHRWWVVLGSFAVITAITVGVTSRMPDIYRSDTTILVDPQKVPENYVKPTVTGDVRNRLGTLSQQILSVTRLQKIIDTFNLYPVERKSMAREDVIAKMRNDIEVSMVNGHGQDLEAFRISYRGRDPRLVALVTTQLAELFIDENLKARAQQATGTTEFLKSQLDETKNGLEAQEAKLRDFKLKHIGEMPEQQASDLQLLGQYQSQLQLESEALSRAEQQKTYVQSMMAQSMPVVDVDDESSAASSRDEGAKPGARAAVSVVESDKDRLASLLAHGYTERHPDVQKLKAKIAQEENEGPKAVVPAVPVPPPAAPPKVEVAKGIKPRPVSSMNFVNPVLESQLKGYDDEIAKHKREQERLKKLVGEYQTKLDAIPVREQEISDLVRDYEISKAHYTQLLGNQLSAETATELEVRAKGEQFTVLDPAQPAERPTSPNRPLLDGAGAAAGLVIGIILALMTEFLGISITASEQLAACSGLPVLEVIPVITTHADRVVRKRRIRLAVLSGVLATLLMGCAIVILHYRGQMF